MSFLVVVLSIITFCAQSSDIYCAWNRAIKPINLDNAGTFNFINGEFTRWYDYASGDDWQGQPYYKHDIPGSCYVIVLYLYRHIDSSSMPPTNKWVIGPNMGMPPEYGYAYCSVDSVNQASPYGACDGNWMIGFPQDDSVGSAATHAMDTEFYLQPGGCPQVTCAELEYSDKELDDWAGTFEYHAPNIYRMDDANTGTEQTSETGEWFLFFYPKVWTWAIDEKIDDYYNCEKYKYGIGFTSVANVIVGSAHNSMKFENEYWYYTPATGSGRTIDCKGTVATPSPTAMRSLIPTAAPLMGMDCAFQSTCTGAPQKYVDEYVAVCGYCPDWWSSDCDVPLCTQVSNPTIPNPKLTGSPVSAGQPASQPASQPALQPASGPSGPSGPSGSNGPSPTSPGTAKPTSPTTSSPTDQYGNAAPTTPTTKAPTSAGTKKPTSKGSSNDAQRLNGNVYVWGVVLAIYRLLF